MSPSLFDLPGTIALVILGLIVLCGLVWFVGWPVYHRITLQKIIALIGQLRDMDQEPFLKLNDHYLSHPEWVAEGFSAVMSDVSLKLLVAYRELLRLEQDPKTDQTVLDEQSLSVANLETEFKVRQEDNANFYHFVARQTSLKRARKTT